MSLCDVLKRREQEKLPFDEENGIASFVFATCRMFKQIILEANIFGSFSEGVFEFDISVQSCCVRLDGGKLGKTPGFQKTLVLNFLLEKLSARLQRIKFRWINQQTQIRFVSAKFDSIESILRDINWVNLEKVVISTYSSNNFACY
jgi:hypothetical protein